MRITPQQHNTALAAAQAELELQRELADSSGIGLWFEEAAGIDGLRIDGVVNLPALVTAILQAATPVAAAPRSTSLDGATSHPAADSESANAGEFAASWNSRTPADREKLHEAIVTGSRASIACFMGNHTARLAELAAEVVQLRETANEWQGKVYQANNISLNLAAKLVAVQDWLDDRAFPGADDDVLQQIIDRDGTPEGFERRNQYRAIWEGGSTSMPLSSMIPLLEEAERRDVVLISERRAFLAGPWKSTSNDPTNQDPTDQEPAHD